MSINEKDFTEKSIQGAAEIYENINLEPGQRQIIETFGSSLHKYVPIIEIALRGFVLKGVRYWQMERKKTIGEMLTMAPQDRTDEAVKISQYVYEELKQVIRDPAKYPQIQNGIEDFLEVYKQKFI